MQMMEHTFYFKQAVDSIFCLFLEGNCLLKNGVFMISLLLTTGNIFGYWNPALKFFIPSKPQKSMS
jgi:hypothetical protein